jgi:hypothetical protein
MLVGRSHECDNPEWVRRLPSCSAPAFDVSVSSGEIDAEVRRRLQSGEPLYHIHDELIRELRADLLITQSHCEVCAVTPGDLERSGACSSPERQVALSASCLEEIFQGVLRIARELGLEERGGGHPRRTGAPDRVREKVAVSDAQPWSCGNGPTRFSPWATGVLSWWNCERRTSLGEKGYSRPLLPTSFERPIRSIRSWALWINLSESAGARPSDIDGGELQAVRGGTLRLPTQSALQPFRMTVSQTAEVRQILHGVSFGKRTEGVRWCRIEHLRLQIRGEHQLREKDRLILSSGKDSAWTPHLSGSN